MACLKARWSQFVCTLLCYYVFVFLFFNCINCFGTVIAEVPVMYLCRTSLSGCLIKTNFTSEDTRVRSLIADCYEPSLNYTCYFATYLKTVQYDCSELSFDLTSPSFTKYLQCCMKGWPALEEWRSYICKVGFSYLPILPIIAGFFYGCVQSMEPTIKINKPLAHLWTREKSISKKHGWNTPREIRSDQHFVSDWNH